MVEIPFNNMGELLEYLFNEYKNKEKTETNLVVYLNTPAEYSFRVSSFDEVLLNADKTIIELYKKQDGKVIFRKFFRTEDIVLITVRSEKQWP